MSLIRLVAGLVLLTVCLPVAEARAQGGTVTGRVVDATTSQPLSGASVVVVGTQQGVLTSADGTYQLTNVPAGAQQIRAS